jgi:hypothetical protein
MPYRGLKESGMGIEEPRYAVEEMTESKMVVKHMEYVIILKYKVGEGLRDLPTL